MSALPLRPRTTLALVLATVVGLVAFCWPLLLTPEPTGLEHSTDAPLVLAVVLVAVLGVVFVAVGEGGIDVKAIAVLGLLSAVGAVLRPLSAGTAGVELVFIVIVLGGRVFGPGFGFALGSTTIFASALITGGVGPWLPFQMIAASWVGLGAGLLPTGRTPSRPPGRGEVVLLASYGAVAAFAFGVAMNFSFWPFALGLGTELSFVPGDPLGDNLRRFGLYSLATSLGWDIGRALTTALGVAMVGAPVLAALRRTAVRAAFEARVDRGLGSLLSASPTGGPASPPSTVPNRGEGRPEGPGRVIRPG